MIIEIGVAAAVGVIAKCVHNYIVRKNIEAEQIEQKESDRKAESTRQRQLYVESNLLSCLYCEQDFVGPMKVDEIGDGGEGFGCPKCHLEDTVVLSSKNSEYQADLVKQKRSEAQELRQKAILEALEQNARYVEQFNLSSILVVTPHDSPNQKSYKECFKKWCNTTNDYDKEILRNCLVNSIDNDFVIRRLTEKDRKILITIIISMWRMNKDKICRDCILNLYDNNVRLDIWTLAERKCLITVVHVMAAEGDCKANDALYNQVRNDEEMGLR